ncbi:hypothetical protein [Campylobacter sp. RM16188]|uniref:hypothetical protein n=1 Tax=Campylobacter sp. RM16188 TaxID=1705725 RepID=UPI001552017F|nr:hypothetical protein [Campylobacter sp. RM16188]
MADFPTLIVDDIEEQGEVLPKTKKIIDNATAFLEKNITPQKKDGNKKSVFLLSHLFLHKPSGIVIGISVSKMRKSSIFSNVVYFDLAKEKEQEGKIFLNLYASRQSENSSKIVERRDFLYQNIPFIGYKTKKKESGKLDQYFFFVSKVDNKVFGGLDIVKNNFEAHIMILYSMLQNNNFEPFDSLDNLVEMSIYTKFLKSGSRFELIHTAPIHSLSFTCKKR